MYRRDGQETVKSRSSRGAGALRRRWEMRDGRRPISRPLGTRTVLDEVCSVPSVSSAAARYGCAFHSSVSSPPADTLYC